MLKIYGVYRSRASRVYWLAGELGIAFESIPVIQANRLGDPFSSAAPVNTRSPTYLAINPMGQIPSIDDDGLILHESLAINLYLARKHGGPLSARNSAEDALISAWSLWGATSVEPSTVSIVLTFDRRLESTSAGKGIISNAVKALRLPFAVLDQHLQRSAYLVGDRFTVADLNVAEILRYAMSQTELFEAAPNVTRWLRRCQARAAFAEMMEVRAREPE